MLSSGTETECARTVTTLPRTAGTAPSWAGGTAGRVRLLRGSPAPLLLSRLTTALCPCSSQSLQGSRVKDIIAEQRGQAQRGQRARSLALPADTTSAIPGTAVLCS